MRNYSNFASLITDSGMLIFHDGKQYTVPNDHPNFSKISDAMKAKQYDLIADLVDIRASVHKWINSGKAFGFRLDGDRITLNNDPFSGEVTDKVLSMIEAGAPPEPLFAFLRKVRQNPSKTAQDELLLFCVANGFMIHEDGDVLAYKSVREDYKDIYSGKFDNSVGKVVEMPRHQVDDNRNVTCSVGLHFAAFKYVSESYTGPHIMLIKVNPKDVVSIPSDYHNQKGRCSRYEVIAELTTKQPLPKREVYTARDLPAPLTIGEAFRPSAVVGSKPAESRKDKLIRDLNRKIVLHKRLDEEYRQLSNIPHQRRRTSGEFARMTRIEGLCATLHAEADMIMDELENGLNVQNFDRYFDNI